ncbi:hypothetical protein TIFTF001_046933 [Ficus carica]|uniref:Uncharacterized protein n=1 Tax=Ficus carica TaxID=3494 RepID=A0AA87YQJ7_FICCA|nr:hypothetical protein TIFTF001_046933 [Ficus carica]
MRVSSVLLSTCTMALSKRSRYFFNVSASPCFMPNRWDAPNFLVFEHRNAVAKESASCLKQPIDPGASLRCSSTSVEPSYDVTEGILNLAEYGETMTAGIPGLPKRSKTEVAFLRTSSPLPGHDRSYLSRQPTARLHPSGWPECDGFLNGPYPGLRFRLTVAVRGPPDWNHYSFGSPFAWACAVLGHPIGAEVSGCSAIRLEPGCRDPRNLGCLARPWLVIGCSGSEYEFRLLERRGPSF